MTGRILRRTAGGMLLAAGALTLSANSASADVVLSPLFGDNMVLQRDKKVNVWGQADPGEKIVLTFDGATARTTANAEGKWHTQLPAHKAGGPFELRVAGNNQITLQNVLVGEVWLCSGQSNMERSIKTDLKPEAAQAYIEKADHPQIRLFTVTKARSDSPLQTLQGSWQVCSPATAGGFSATGYFFGREVQASLGVPVGLICSAWGGTPSEAWTSQPALAKDPAYPQLDQTWQKLLADYPAAMQRYQEQTLPRWQEAVDKAKAAGTPPPRRPGAPMGADSPQKPSILFNGMIAPLIPFTVRGVAWYQGESNADQFIETQQYRTLFPTLIQDWRSRWGEDLPFVFVQLANYRAVQTEPTEASFWPFLREAQLDTLKLPNTGMAVAIDVNEKDEPDNIHPRNKELIGTRLARVALAKVYKKKVAYSGPRFRSMRIDGGKARLQFDHTEGGLVAQGATEPNKLQGFAVAGADGNFVWADAVIEGNTVVVSSAQVPQPVAVRYDWAMNPIGNLYNKDGLPASPFRTDTTTGLPVKAAR